MIHVNFYLIKKAQQNYLTTSLQSLIVELKKVPFRAVNYGWG